MPSPIRKASFTCPDCGFVQQEPEQLVSTFCRSCGRHYEVRAAEPSRKEGAASANAARPQRAVMCYRCERTHDVSVSARSTLCPGCNAAIEFGDITFFSIVSRPVDTRGKLTVEAKGSLTNSHIICGDAVIFGKINGVLRCERTMRLGSSGRLGCRITTGSLIIEKRARVEFVHRLETVDLVVHGHAAGDFDCAGRVEIRKGGVLEGKLRARSIVVDRGGVLLAESEIEPRPREAAV